jgi:hypothetical protein
MNYQEMKVADLRREVRKRGLASGLAVAGARKDVLIQALSLGRWPEAEVHGSPSPGGSLVSAYCKLVNMARMSGRDPSVYQNAAWRQEYFCLQGRILEALDGLDRGKHD